jgi:tetratricopeptide (TPR) repeat protein
VLDALVESLGGTRLLVIVTYRPEYQNGWARHSYYALVRLGPLETNVADRLLCSLFGDAAELGSLRRYLIAQTDGTPLFLEEIARALVETGALVSEPPRYRLTCSLGELEIPGSVQGVLASRIDRLPVEVRTLLQIASVIGQDVPTDLLRAVADVPERQLHRQLHSLEFFCESSGFSGTEFTFKHALTRAVAYDSMLLRHRRVLHAQVMEATEQTYPERLDEFTGRLAEHALRAEAWDKAVAYCHRAGQRANDRSAHLEATGFFERALEAVARLPSDRDTIGRAIQIRLGLRVALAASADLVRVRKHLDEAETLARSIDDQHQLLPIIVSKSTILSNLGALDEAVAAGLHGRALAEQLNDRAVSRAPVSHSASLLEPRRFPERDRCPAARYLGRAHALAGRIEDARSLLAEAVDQAKAQSLVALHGWCAASLGLTELLSGAPDAAESVTHLALDLARQHGYRPLEAHALRLLGEIAARSDAGEPAAVARAESWFREAASLAQAMGMRPELAQTRRGLADLLVRTDRPDEARAELASAVDLHCASGMGSQAAQASEALAALSERFGQPV